MLTVFSTFTCVADTLKEPPFVFLYRRRISWTIDKLPSKCIWNCVPQLKF